MPAPDVARVVTGSGYPQRAGQYQLRRPGKRNQERPFTGDLRTSLLAAIQSTDKNIDDAQRAIEGWYDDGMDRVTGWYKRKTQTWTMVMAIILTIAVNADTVHIARRLWLEPALRAEFVEAGSHPPAPQMSISAAPAGQISTSGGGARDVTSEARKYAWPGSWLARRRGPAPSVDMVRADHRLVADDLCDFSGRAVLVRRLEPIYEPALGGYVTPRKRQAPEKPRMPPANP